MQRGSEMRDASEARRDDGRMATEWFAKFD